MTPLFIAAEKLKSVSIVNNNVDVKLLEPTIIMVQDIDIMSILGEDLYDQICDQINTSTVSANNAILLDKYIEPYLINAVLSQALIDLSTKVSNKNVAEQTSSWTSGVDADSLKRLSNKYHNSAQIYGERLYLYLSANKSDYPLYSANVESWKQKPTNFIISQNIFLGNVRNYTKNK